jgi:hypothetical protein
MVSSESQKATYEKLIKHTRTGEILTCMPLSSRSRRTDATGSVLAGLNTSPG